MSLYLTHRICGKRNLSEEIIDIFISDVKLTCSMLKSRGLLFFIALSLTLCVSLLKVGHCVWTYLFDPHYTLADLSRRNLQDESHRNRMNERDVVTAMINIEHEKRHKHQSKKELERVEALSFLRTYLLNRNFTLTAQVIKSVEHSVSDDILREYLHSGKIIKPYQTEYIDFGEKINNALKQALGKKISLRKVKDCPYPCVAVFNGEIESIQKELENLFLGNKIRILFDTPLNKRYN